MSSNSGVHMSRSFYDLMQYPPFKKAVQQENKEEFEKILFELGFDLEQGYEIIEILHRPITTNQAWYGSRIEGMERTDPVYIKSGNASRDAIIASSSDPTLRAELNMMCRTGQSDVAFFDKE